MQFTHFVFEIFHFILDFNYYRNLHQNGIQHMAPPDYSDVFSSLLLILLCCPAWFYTCKFHICQPIYTDGLLRIFFFF